MRYGRRDLTEAELGDTTGLPAGRPPFPSGDGPAGHLRAVFYRMGLSDEDIVALSGAHTLGRAHKHRSGTTGEAQRREGLVGGAQGCGSGGREGFGIGA